ncbi:MAG: hypothetical protein RSE38_01195 [Acinetobacter sp.]
MKKELDFGLNFHQTFPPSPAYIGRILSIADGQKKSAREISDITGIPQGESSGKVVPHLKYAAYMGLITPDITAPVLTPLGQVVQAEDHACSEEITQWLMHRNLTSVQGAPMWHFICRDLLHNNHGTLSTEYLTNQMINKFGTAKFAPVLTTYQELFAIGYLQPIKTAGAISIQPQRIQREFLYLYAYELLSEWDARYPATSEITAEECTALASATCFGLQENLWFEVLEQLSTMQICRINKQLAPYTIVRLSGKDSLITKLYSLLI